MLDLRCKYCNRLLMKIDYGKGEVKCGRCNRIIFFNVETQQMNKLIERLKIRDRKVLDNKASIV